MFLGKYHDYYKQVFDQMSQITKRWFQNSRFTIVRFSELVKGRMKSENNLGEFFYLFLILKESLIL